jgi:2-hydroxychromene-2-carboxylate isomerase
VVAVDFYLGIGSRYSYLAATQVDRIERECGCRFVWKPIASGTLLDRRGANPFKTTAGSGQYDWRYREYDAKCWAALYGVPFREPPPFKADATLPALACLAAEAQGALVACCRLLLHMIFVDGIEVDDRAISDLPGRLGIDAGSFAETLAGRDVRARHEALLEEAQSRGVFGVPTFFAHGHSFWGNDRLVLLEACLKGRAMPRM